MQLFKASAILCGNITLNVLYKIKTWALVWAEQTPLPLQALGPGQATAPTQQKMYTSPARHLQVHNFSTSRNCQERLLGSSPQPGAPLSHAWARPTSGARRQPGCHGTLPKVINYFVCVY